MDDSTSKDDSGQSSGSPRTKVIKVLVIVVSVAVGLRVLDTISAAPTAFAAGVGLGVVIEGARRRAPSDRNYFTRILNFFLERLDAITERIRRILEKE